MILLKQLWKLLNQLVIDMRIYAVGGNIEWFDKNEYFKKVLKFIMLDHGDGDIPLFVDRYLPILAKKIIGINDLVIFNNRTFLSFCLNDDLSIDLEALGLSIDKLLDMIQEDVEIRIELIIPKPLKNKDDLGSTVMTSLNNSGLVNVMVIVRSINKLEKELEKGTKFAYC